jgi:S1-C subfamily serine protease
VTALRGTVREGNSGGPVVDERGRVVATVFGGRTGAGEPGGYGVSTELVRQALTTASSGKALSTTCVSR